MSSTPPAPIHAHQTQAAPDPATMITACIVCRNEADRLAACLESVAWADEIIVMDLMSSDGSAELAQRYGARVVQREPYPIVEPLRNELAALAHSLWVLALDPDERVTPGLAGELRQVALRPELDAVVVPRMNFDLGYPPSSPVQRYEPQLRMYRRDRVNWPLVPNKLPKVDEARLYRVARQDDRVLIHDRSRNIPEVLERVVRYAPMQAQSMLEAGERFSAQAMAAALLAQLDKDFFRARAWEDGVPGVFRAAILVGYKFYVWAAFWQQSGAKRTAADDRLVRRMGLTALVVRRLIGRGLSLINGLGRLSQRLRR